MHLWLCVFLSTNLENAARNQLMKLYLFQNKSTSKQQQTIHHQLRQRDRHYQNCSHLKSLPSPKQSPTTYEASLHHFINSYSLAIHVEAKLQYLQRLSSYLCESGFEVIIVPEAFTILASNNGFQPLCSRRYSILCVEFSYGHVNRT